MRTTLEIDSDVLNMARALADAQKISIGKALSELARRGVHARTPVVKKNGLLVFHVPGAQPFGPEEVQAALDAEDLPYADQFLDPDHQ